MSVENILLFLFVDLAIIIIAARAFGWAAKQVGQPAVAGEMLAGIVLGPTILGRFGTHLPMDLFPGAVPLKSLSDLGLVFFMFLVGLELDPKLVRSQGVRALKISLSGIILPLGAGILVGLILRDVNNQGVFVGGTKETPHALTFALFVGASMCITAFPVLARMLIETGLYKTAVGTATLCAAAVDDVCAWILLAAVVGIAKTGSPLQAGRTFLLTAVFVVFMAVVVRRLLQLLARRYDASGTLTVDQVAIVVIGLLLSAYTTEKIGVHAIFGAFVFGGMMPHRARMTRELTDKIEDFTVVVLLPVFFTVTGLRTNLFTLNSPSLIGGLLLILAVAIGGKFIGCGVAARLTGSSTREAIVVGSLMNTRGLTELVILSIGLSLGVLSDRVFAMMVIMALTTTVMAAPIVNRLMPRDKLMRELAQAEDAGRPKMAARVLVIVGNPLNAQSLVDVGIRLAGVRRPAELMLVRLIPTPRAPQFRTGLLEEESEIAASVDSMRALVVKAEAAGMTARPLSFLTDDLTADVVRMAADRECDAIVSGWHRASVDRGVIQTSVHRLFRLAHCDVAVFVDKAGFGIRPDMDRAVLAAMTGGEHDEAVARLADQFAQNLGSSVWLAGYVEAEPGAQAHGHLNSESLAAQADALRSASGLWVVPYFFEDDALQQTVELTKEAILAVHGLGDDFGPGLDFGYPASAFADLSACPVVIVRGAGKARAAGTGRRLLARHPGRQAVVASRR